MEQQTPTPEEPDGKSIGMDKFAKLNKLVNKMADEGFEYGKNDCYSFTTALVKEWHGEDLSKIHKVYKNRKQAEEYMRKSGGIEALTTGTIGYPRKSPKLCEDGDVVTAEVEKGVIGLGFVFDGKGLFLMKKTVAKIPLDKCRMGWKIK